jgi:sugar lactone lactonase YvrE
MLRSFEFLALFLILVTSTTIHVNASVARPLENSKTLLQARNISPTRMSIQQSSSVTLVAQGFIQPDGLAMDSSGNIYVAEDIVKDIKMIHTDGTVETLLTGTNYNVGLAIDQNGNLYFTSWWGKSIQMLPQGCSSMSCVQTILSNSGPLSCSQCGPRGIAVDSSGNVYFEVNTGLDNPDGVCVNSKVWVVHPDGSYENLTSDQPCLGGLLSLGPDSCLYWGIPGTDPTRSGIWNNPTPEIRRHCLGTTGYETLLQLPPWTATTSYQPYNVLVDSSGIMYWTTDGSGQVWELDKSVSPEPILLLDYSPAVEGYSYYLDGMVLDSSGNLYFDDYCANSSCGSPSAPTQYAVVESSSPPISGAVYRLNPLTAQGFVSGTFLALLPVSGGTSSGPDGDQSTGSVSFTPSLESIPVAGSGSQQYLLVATSQLWDSSAAIGASMAVCKDGSRLSGDMYSVGAVATHRHLATAMALDTPSGGSHAYTLCFKTDPGGTAFVSGTVLIMVPISGALSSGPGGDQSSGSSTFTPSTESISVNPGGSQQYFAIATSQLWDSSPGIGASIAVCLDGARLSGDMYSAGPVATHRHLATAIALTTLSGSHTFTLCYKTDPGGTAFVSGTFLIVVPVSGGLSSGPSGDQSTSSVTFTPSAESIVLTPSGSQQYFAVATSQLWDLYTSSGASIAVCFDGSRLSGDMYSAGAVATHRHLATAIALNTPTATSHTYSLCYKTDPGNGP